MTPDYIELDGQRYRMVVDLPVWYGYKWLGEATLNGVTYRIGQVKKYTDLQPVKIAYRVGVVAKGTWVHKCGQDKE